MLGKKSKWLKEDGEIFIKEIGIKKNQIVLDFGCGEGHYTIPAARVIGKGGKVYALDKDKDALDKLIKTAKKEGLKNIKIMKTEGELKIPLRDESVNVVLLYDVLHPYYNIKGPDERRKLLDDVNRVLKPNSFVSIYPKHLESENIRKEVEEASFSFERKYFTRLIHDNSYEKDYIFNFRKIRLRRR